MNNPDFTSRFYVCIEPPAPQPHIKLVAMWLGRLSPRTYIIYPTALLAEAFSPEDSAKAIRFLRDRYPALRALLFEADSRRLIPDRSAGYRPGILRQAVRLERFECRVPCGQYDRIHEARKGVVP